MNRDLMAQYTSASVASVKDRVSPEEWEARTELAALYRLVDHFRWTDTIYNHISLRVPGEDSLLINPYGYWYSEITASSLVKVSGSGDVLHDPTGFGINPAGFIIHGAIHAARPDVHCVIHTHTRAGCAVAAHEAGLLHISQQAAILADRVAYHDFEGIATRPDEQKRLVANLGDRNLLILRNHGLLSAGTSAGEAFFLMNMLERACEIQVAALASGGAPVRQISPSSIANTQEALKASTRRPERDWAAMLRLVKRTAPDYAK